MAPRKVTADSEDEDEGESVSIPSPGGEFDRPEPEPLSPHGQSPSPAPYESSKDALDMPNSSFTDKVGRQGSLAAHQSNLIENIVRQSQRASAVSSDVSLPAKKTGARLNPSSGTDVTSPRRRGKSRNQASLLHDDTSAFTTPRQSTGQEWEIPSSPEEAAAPQSAACSRSKEAARITIKEKESGSYSSSVAPEMLPAEGATGTTLGRPRTGLAPTSAPKKTQLSYHDSTPLETTSFYVAQSTLTTMQKLEYEKVNVSSNSYGGHPGSLPKSSYATTIQYPTPRGYSPAPPFPWEVAGAQPSSPQRNETTNISSSPDVIGFDCDLPNEKSPVVGLGTGAPNLDHEPAAKSQGQTPIGRGKKRRVRDDEDDELGQDDAYNPDNLDLPQEYYRPRATKRRSAGSVGLSVAKNGKEVLTADSVPELPLYDISPGVGKEIQDDEFSVPPLPDTDPPEPPREEPPKKRGRKRKQPAVDTAPTPRTEANQDSYLDQNHVSPVEEPVTKPSPAKPKKKRGRPRKSDSSKAIKEPPPELPIADERPRAASSRTKGDANKSTADLRDDGDNKESIEEEEQEQEQEQEESKVSEEDVEDAASKDDRPPLKEVNSNKKPSATKLDPAETPPTKPTAEPDDDEKPTPKPQAKETPKSSISQPKVKYRVGLSKRSRIAPLLKTIKK